MGTRYLQNSASNNLLQYFPNPSSCGSSISASSSSSRVLASPLLLLHVMDRTLPEGAIIGTPAFAVVSVDGSRGACLFGTVAAALADGSTPEGLRATAASLVRRRPNALVQFGAELRSVAELAALLAAESPLVYASELAREGTWGDALALAVLASLHGLRAHVLLPRGRAGTFKWRYGVCFPRRRRVCIFTLLVSRQQ